MNLLHSVPERKNWEQEFFVARSADPNSISGNPHTLQRLQSSADVIHALTTAMEAAAAGGASACSSRGASSDQVRCPANVDPGAPHPSSCSAAFADATPFSRVLSLASTISLSSTGTPTSSGTESLDEVKLEHDDEHRLLVPDSTETTRTRQTPVPAAAGASATSSGSGADVLDEVSSKNRIPYRRRQHEVKSTIHWGQRKLFLAELEFLLRLCFPRCLQQDFKSETATTREEDTGTATATGAPTSSCNTTSEENEKHEAGDRDAPDADEDARTSTVPVPALDSANFDAFFGCYENQVLPRAESLRGNKDAFFLVYYMGAAPGEHLALLAKWFSKSVFFILYDPRDFRVKEAAEKLLNVDCEDEVSEAEPVEGHEKQVPGSASCRTGETNKRRRSSPSAVECKNTSTFIGAGVGSVGSKPSSSHEDPHTAPASSTTAQQHDQEQSESASSRRKLSLKLENGQPPFPFTPSSDNQAGCSKSLRFSRSDSGFSASGGRLVLPNLETRQRVFDYDDERFVLEEDRERWQAGRVVLISDIRSADPREEEDFDEKALMEDMRAQEKWVEVLQPELAMLKFRLPYGEGKMDYLGGQILLPAFGPQTTTECRLLTSATEKKTSYDFTEYCERMFFFNTVQRVQVYPDAAIMRDIRCAGSDDVLANQSLTPTAMSNVKLPLRTLQLEHGLDACYDCTVEKRLLAVTTDVLLMSAHSCTQLGGTQEGSDKLKLENTDADPDLVDHDHEEVLWQKTFWHLHRAVTTACGAETGRTLLSTIRAPGSSQAPWGKRPMKNNPKNKKTVLNKRQKRY